MVFFYDAHYCWCAIIYLFLLSSKMDYIYIFRLILILFDNTCLSKKNTNHAKIMSVFIYVSCIFKIQVFHIDFGIIITILWILRYVFQWIQNLVQKYKEDQHHLPALKICQDCCNGHMKIGRLYKEGLKQITRHKTCSFMIIILVIFVHLIVHFCEN